MQPFEMDSLGILVFRALCRDYRTRMNVTNIRGGKKIELFCEMCAIRAEVRGDFSQAVYIAAVGRVIVTLCDLIRSHVEHCTSLKVRPIHTCPGFAHAAPWN